MILCGSCRHNSLPSPLPATLFQIHEKYRAHWRDLSFCVEADGGQWTLRVEDTGRRPAVYTAHRSSLKGARLAAAEFASFHGLDRELSWQQYW